MIKANGRRGGALRLLSWARIPRQAKELYDILAETRDDELIMLMTRVGGPGGHIAWAEYGRRRYGTTFGIESGQARPIVTSGMTEVWS